MVLVRFNVTRGRQCPHHSRSIQGFRPPHVPAVSPGLSFGSERRLSSGNAVGRPASGPAAACRDFYIPLFCQVPVILLALGLHPMELGSVSSGRIRPCSTQGLPAWRRYSFFALLQRATWGNRSTGLRVRDSLATTPFRYGGTRCMGLRRSRDSSTTLPGPAVRSRVHHMSVRFTRCEIE